MRKLIAMNIWTIITLIVTSYGVYYLLIEDQYLHVSISSITAFSHHLRGFQHLVMLALLPVYIAMLMFGAAVLSFYIGQIVPYFLSKFMDKS